MIISIAQAFLYRQPSIVDFYFVSQTLVALLNQSGKNNCYLCYMHLSIKNMVCERCILVVRQELDKLNIKHTSVTLGEVETAEEITEKQLLQLKTNLAIIGFELLDDNKHKIIEKIKTVIIEQIHYSDADDKHNFSEILSQKLHKDYSYLSSLFSDVESVTIEKYIINQKIEKVKELLVYDELNLSEIAFKLGYSSVAHLSTQFKKVTGLTPSHFKKLGGIHRKPLDKV